MTPDEKLALLREWKQRYDDLDKQWGALAILTGGLTDSPLGDAVWLLWDAYTKQIAERVGDAEAQAVHLLRMLNCDNEQRPYEAFFAPSGECA